jgi:adenine/guanine phosphoribosyltransferase-like PRPP-binding protein
MPGGFFTEPTTGYWQELTADVPARFSAAPPYRFGYPARLPDDRVLVLPLRQLPTDDLAVASLIANQASHPVLAVLADHMAALAGSFDAEIVVGLPTLGLVFASLVASRLGQPRYVPLGYSRKFWYDDALSEVAVSSTSPDQSKRVYLDPALLDRVQQRRIVIVDDVLNTGGTMTAAVRLLQRAQAEVVAIIAVLTEGWDWHRALARIDPMLPEKVHALGHIPLFGRVSGGWAPLPDTELAARPG